MCVSLLRRDAFKLVEKESFFSLFLTNTFACMNHLRCHRLKLPFRLPLGDFNACDWSFSPFAVRVASSSFASPFRDVRTAKCAVKRRSLGRGPVQVMAEKRPRAANSVGNVTASRLGHTVKEIAHTFSFLRLRRLGKSPRGAE